MVILDQRRIVKGKILSTITAVRISLLDRPSQSRLTKTAAGISNQDQIRAEETVTILTAILHMAHNRHRSQTDKGQGGHATMPRSSPCFLIAKVARLALQLSVLSNTLCSKRLEQGSYYCQSECLHNGMSCRHRRTILARSPVACIARTISRQRRPSSRSGGRPTVLGPVVTLALEHSRPVNRIQLVP